MTSLLAALVLAGARVAVLPLGGGGDAAQASFDVLLARVPEVRFAGMEGIEEALAKPAGRDCASRDACLRFVAESTESQYAVHAALRTEQGVVRGEARVVRADGVVVRRASASGAAERAVLGQLVDGLALGSLEADGPFAVAADASPRRPVGYTLMGAGIATVVAGAVMGGLAIEGDRRQADAAIVLVPMGAVLGVAGGLLALWP